MSRRPIRHSFPPVGVKVYREGDILPEVPRFCGISWCRAVLEAGNGPLVVGPGSISVCRWSPPVLGLKEPETEFERDLEPRLPFRPSGLLLCRMDQWPAGAGEPEVVIVRAEREEFGKLLGSLDRALVYDGPSGIDRTMAYDLLGDARHPARLFMVKAVNGFLNLMGAFRPWRKAIVWAFDREWTSRALDFILDRGMANMSMCRNSTVIPWLTGRVNVSHFCTGGIVWGQNPPHLMTGGIPYGLYKEMSASGKDAGAVER